MRNKNGLKDKRFELADQAEVFELDRIAEKFFAEILSMDYAEIMITDESWLSDFAPYCGEDASDYPTELQNDSLTRKEAYSIWSRWVNQKIEITYGVPSSQMRNGNPVLVRPFHAIKAAPKQSIQ